MTCSIPNCGNISERNGKCASCNRLQRKALKDLSKPPKEKKLIAKTSDKMAQALREYSKLRKEFLAANPLCEVYKDRPATDVHHMKGRATIELLLDTKLFSSRKP